MNSLVELTDAELDAVTGGANAQGNAFGGLINVGLGAAVDTVSVLDNNRVNISLLDGSNVQVPIGVAANLLGTSVQSIRQL